MLKISFITPYSEYTNLVVIKPSEGDFPEKYRELNALCDAVGLKSKGTFTNTDTFTNTGTFANICGAKCLTIVMHKDDTSFQELGDAIYQAVKTYDSVYVDATHMQPQTVVDMAVGMRLKSYTFDRYKTISKKEQADIAQITLITHDVDAVESLYVRHSAIVDGVFQARDVANEPANILTPAQYANRAKGLAKYGVKVTIMEPDALQKLGMGALLGVAQGSANPARVVVMEYNGGNAGDAPFAFVGKGVTFDTGGISIKPSAGMEEMKFDMGGSAAVYGAMHAIAMRKARANVVGIIGLVENMPDGNAQRPGDIVTSMSGQTIEVLNTDAEGRLVLADCLTYVQQKHHPKCIINLATLTGAIMVALGMEYAGMFSNNYDFAKHILKVSEQAGEKFWHMPAGKEFDKLIDSPVADIKNISSGRWGGACTAAAFLARFVDKDTPWVHLDIAGTAFNSKQGGTGFGVATLDQVVYDFETNQ